MRHCHCGCGDGGFLLLIIILPIVFIVWFMKMIAKSLMYICAVGISAGKSLHSALVERKKDSTIPTEEEIDEYEVYEDFLDD